MSTKYRRPNSTPHLDTPPTSTTRNKFSAGKKFGMSICSIMKVFQLRVSLIITRKIYSIIVLSNVPVVLIILDLVT